MHYLVTLIVEGENKFDAHHAADAAMMDLVEQHEFDWYHDTEEGSRWPNCWKPRRLNTVKGQELVASAMKQQYDEFCLSMDTVRVMLRDYTDEQIYNEDFGRDTDYQFTRYRFTVLSGYHANAGYLFGAEADGILNQPELDVYLEHPEKYWVVQVDCHN